MDRAYIIDMDGVLVRGRTIIPGAPEFIDRLNMAGRPYLVLTNNSRFTPEEHAESLQGLGIRVLPRSIFTSAIATAHFLRSQRPGGTAFMIGEVGLLTALKEAGYLLSEDRPDYVVLGETVNYSFERITRAIQFVLQTVPFIATNADVIGPAEEGLGPATGAVAALIAASTGVQAYFVGKPNPLMMRSAVRQLGTHSEHTTVIGDNMKTDIIGGMESGMETILVLSGVTSPEQVGAYPYRPTRVVGSVAEIDP